jgi:hypothetical protein
VRHDNHEGIFHDRGKACFIGEGGKDHFQEGVAFRFYASIPVPDLSAWWIAAQQESSFSSSLLGLGRRRAAVGERHLSIAVWLYCTGGNQQAKIGVSEEWCSSHEGEKTRWARREVVAGKSLLFNSYARLPTRIRRSVLVEGKVEVDCLHIYTPALAAEQLVV